MTAPTVVTKKSDEPILILIVDREGKVGEKLAEKLKSEATVVLVSQKVPSIADIIHIPFDKKIPQIPDNTYSHIFVVDDGSKITREALSSFLQKAEDDNAHFFFAAHMREINEKLINDLTAYYKKAKILFFGDIFGGGPKEKESYINKFIAQARLKNKILVPGDGTSVSYPIYFEDLIEGVLEAVFGQNDDKIFYAFPKYPPTHLTLAREIAKSNPHVLIDFSKEKALENINIPINGKYLLPEKYPIEARIKKIEIKEKPFAQRNEVEEEIDDVKQTPLFFPRFGFFGILILILLPLISTLLLLFLGNISAKGVEIYLDKGDLEKAQKSAFFGRTYFDLATKTINLIPLINKNFLIKDQNRVLGTSFILEGLKSSDFAEVKKGLIYLQKEKISFPMLNFATSTINVWEELFGFKNKRKYLLLLQDKNELRPTGGVIDSYSLLTLDKGKLLPFEIKDASFLDSKIKGQVEPPHPLRRYLKSSNFSFKDSNFNVEFTQSAEASAILLSVLEEEKVDGAVALDKSLYDEISEELKKEKISYKKVLSKIEEGINKKQILFAFNDQNLQNIFTANNWSSALWDVRIDSKTTVNDFLGVSEANLSKSKINKNISRNVSQNVKLDENGNLSSTLVINYKNEATERYKNYLRLILPLGAKIISFKINDKNVEIRNAIKDPKLYEASNFKEPEELEVDQYNQNGKTIFGFLLEIGSEAIEEVQISYSFPKIINLDSHVSYSLKIFKQPYLTFPYKFSISYPATFKITGGKKAFEKEISRDETILVELVKI